MRCSSSQRWAAVRSDVDLGSACAPSERCFKRRSLSARPHWVKFRNCRIRSRCSNRVFSFCGYSSMPIGSKPSCEQMVSRTGAGQVTRVGQEVPSPAESAQLYGEPHLVNGATAASTCSRSASASVKYFRRLSASMSTGSLSGLSRSLLSDGPNVSSGFTSLPARALARSSHRVHAGWFPHTPLRTIRTKSSLRL
jgi:hypothetical protein